jgi:hypothetical protein
MKTDADSAMAMLLASEPPPMEAPGKPGGEHAPQQL